MIDQYFLVLTTIDLFVLTFMCILTKLSETLNSKQKRGFFLAFVLIGVISILEVIISRFTSRRTLPRLFILRPVRPSRRVCSRIAAAY